MSFLLLYISFSLFFGGAIAISIWLKEHPYHNQRGKRRLRLAFLGASLPCLAIPVVLRVTDSMSSTSTQSKTEVTIWFCFFLLPAILHGSVVAIAFIKGLKYGLLFSVVWPMLAATSVLVTEKVTSLYEKRAYDQWANLGALVVFIAAVPTCAVMSFIIGVLSRLDTASHST